MWCFIFNFSIMSNILVLTTTYPTKNFQVGLHVYDKCKHLVKKGYNVTVIAPHYDGEPIHEIDEGIKIIRFPYFLPRKYQKVAYKDGMPTNLKKSFLAKLQLPFFFLMFLIYSLRYGKDAKIIHAHWFPAGLIGVLVKKIYKNKLVLMMHHAHTPNKLFRYILKNTDALLANTTYVLNKTHAIFDVPHSAVIPVPIDYNFFFPQNDTSFIREELNIPKDSIFFFTAGRFIPLKGFEYLIEAVKIIVHEYNKTNIALAIAGKGPLRKKYIQLIDNYNLKDYIKLVGFIPNNQINKYFNEADIFVIPSIVDENEETEGFGVVSLEANACETPVIGTKVGGIVDVIEEGRNGFLVEQKNARQLADKIIQLSDNKNLREEIGKKGRQKVMEEFNWDRVSDKIISIYEQF